MTTTQQDANDLLMNGGGGVKSAKFNTLGDVVRGTILDDPKVSQVSEFGDDGKPTGEKKFWPSGDPMMQIDVVIQTDQRDPADEDDDGKRVLHITPRLQPAMREAVKTAGAKGLAVGGRIAVQWSSGTGHGKGNPREYMAAYEPPQVGAELLAAPAAAPALTATAAPTQVAPPTTMGLLKAAAPADDIAPPGVDPAKWAALPPQQKAAVRAAMAPADNIPF